MLCGYARVSTIDQDLSIQLDALTAVGCTVIRSEKVTGTSTEGREELATLLEFLREGDTLVVTRIDRLARSMLDLQNIVHDLRQRSVALKATEQPIDTSTAAGKCFLDMLGVFAEFETNLRKERQMEDVARAKANGIYAGKGRPASIDPATVRALKAQGMGATEIAKELGIGRASGSRRIPTDRDHRLHSILLFDPRRRAFFRPDRIFPSPSRATATRTYPQRAEGHKHVLILA
jgi:DNA invertase Pin-like site-specific DNA recombinase